MTTRTAYIVAGGGTGGHLFPGLAVAEELTSRDPMTDVTFIGTDRPIESSILSGYPYRHVSLPIDPLQTLKKRPLRFVFRMTQAYRQAKRLIASERPSAVIGIGGLASVPTILAARRGQVPVVLLEQNVLPGRATRWLCKYASTVCVSFAETASFLAKSEHCVQTGNPVRHRVEELYDAPNSLSGGRTLIVLGGSQGATVLNQAVMAVVERRRLEFAGWRIVHQTGHDDADVVRRCYDRLGVDSAVAGFFDDLAPFLRAASVAVSRAGATTLAELACAGIAAVLVPYPYAADDHQSLNAQFYEDGGGCRVVEQGSHFAEFTERIENRLIPLITTHALRREQQDAMRQLARPDATADVADHVCQLAGRPDLMKKTTPRKPIHLRAG